MTDRDTFAAAALTGLLAQGDDGSFSEGSYVRGAYRWADAMLRERVTEPMPKEKREEVSGVRHARPEGTVQDEGSVPDSRTENGPVAWAVIDGTKALVGYHSCIREKAEAWAREYGFPKVVPLYRQPHHTLTDAEREAVEFAVQHLQDSGWGTAVLRGLLERLK